uniref:Uncharacterized protein n=1 Tax=viral metagenome TaxID=1070528 RepID=A0A6C0EM70_9ZZZZ
MNNFENQVKSLCTPAQIYFFLSMFSVLAIMSQNAMQSRIYRIGVYSVPTPFTNIVTFLMKIISIVIWTYILKYLCDNGFMSIAWFLVLLPIVFMFVMIGAVMLILTENKKAVTQQVAAFQKSQRPGIQTQPQ